MQNKVAILRIDDEQIILNSLENELMDNDYLQDYIIEFAEDADEVMELLEEFQSENIDLALVICDYIMPKMKGDELLIKIHKFYPKAKKIMLTGQANIEGITNSINNANLYRYISKPWEKEDLHLTIKTALESYSKDNILLGQSKLAIMGEMLSMIAHQWRQPLNAINAVAMRMNMQKQMDILSDEKFDSNIKDIKDSTKFLTETINDFRQFFNKDKKLFEVFPKEIVDKVINLLSHRINKNNVKIIKDCKCKSPILIYPNEFQQVVLNILNNAIDEFETKEIKEPIIKIDGYNLKNNFIEIKISDNAGGIPKEIIDKIFDPYFSTKSKNGTGLGLYMSKMIIHDSLSGELAVKNDENGAIFTIKLKYK